MHVVCTKRGEGKTTQLIELCHRLNCESGYNRTIILAKGMKDAERIYAYACQLGYPDIPYPTTLNALESRRLEGSMYTDVLIDDLDYFAQHVIGPRCILVGYSITDYNDKDTIWTKFKRWVRKIFTSNKNKNSARKNQYEPKR